MKLFKNYSKHKFFNNFIEIFVLSLPIIVIFLIILFRNINISISTTQNKATSIEQSNVLIENNSSNLQNNNSAFESLVSQSNVSVDDSYFDDVVFIGDSLTNGLQLYKSVKNAIIISETGLNIESATNKPLMFNNQSVSVLEAIKQANRNKIYIMIGANGIGWLDNDYMIKLYSGWLNNIKSELPNSIIYVQSILPITQQLSDVNQNKPNALTNDKIEIYNQTLHEMCNKNKFHFLNVAEIFKNENNALPDEASPVDGLHLTSKYYNNWLNYIKTHTINNN